MSTYSNESIHAIQLQRMYWIQSLYSNNRSHVDKNERYGLRIQPTLDNMFTRIFERAKYFEHEYRPIFELNGEVIEVAVDEWNNQL